MDATPPSAPVEPRRIARAVCTDCAAFCDDLQLEVEAGRPRRASGACPRGERFLLALEPLEPRAEVDGRAESPARALSAAARILRESRSPLLAGFTDLTLEAQRAAAQLAGTLGAPVCIWPAVPPAVRAAGLHAPELTATLSEVRSTADLVVYLGVDPEQAAPRHLERYSGDLPLLDGGKRRVLRLSMENALPSARKLRLHLERGEEPPADAAWRALAPALLGSRHSHMFLGETVSPALWDELQRLAASLRSRAHLTLSPLLGGGNWRGAVEVLSWLTGRAGSSIDLEEALASGASDTLLAMGARNEETLMALASASPARPTVLAIGPRRASGARVWIRAPGLDPRLAATVVRSDGIHLTLDGRAGDLLDPLPELLRELGRQIADQAATG